MNYQEAKQTAQRLTDDDYGFAQVLELTQRTGLTGESFEKQLRAYCAEFGADEQSVFHVLKEMTDAAQRVCNHYEANEKAEAQGLTP